MIKTLVVIIVFGIIFPLSAQIKVACIGNSITAGEYPKIIQTLLGNTYKVEGMGSIWFENVLFQQ